MSVVILSPLSGDTVPSPVVVTAGYSFANPFTLTCTADSKAEPMGQMHSDVNGVHTSGGIALSPPPPSPIAVTADGMSAGGDAQSNIRVTSGALPVGNITDTILLQAPPPVAGRVKKRHRIDGDCDPATKPAYVICRVSEVDLRDNHPAFKRVAAGADTPKTQGMKLSWSVTLDVEMDVSTEAVQYVARATSYDKDDTPLGLSTQILKKR